MTTTIAKPRTIGTDTGDSDRHCHLAADGRPDVAICGSTKRRHGREGQEPFYGPAPSRCPRCGRPTCPACLAIWRAYRRSGAWEGP